MKWIWSHKANFSMFHLMALSPHNQNENKQKYFNYLKKLEVLKVWVRPKASCHLIKTMGTLITAPARDQTIGKICRLLFPRPSSLAAWEILCPERQPQMVFISNVHNHRIVYSWPCPGNYTCPFLLTMYHAVLIWQGIHLSQSLCWTALDDPFPGDTWNWFC